jgi:hypothetical protein
MHFAAPGEAKDFALHSGKFQQKLFLEPLFISPQETGCFGH